jgi:hypothetical protein
VHAWRECRLEPSRALRIYDLLAACGWIAPVPPQQHAAAAEGMPRSGTAEGGSSLKSAPGSELRLVLPGAEAPPVKEEVPTAMSAAAGMPFPDFMT